ncbi:hypothetical protein F511_27230 [Dorcoceras hygrometricum]|uniref:Uncharacterized protein n=1 Tax=Dorcoceras hygrometricum TaxID=472368 RepID=A0A2Z7BDC5_9LAMI|nr:hypothetical protein F511_27230 [Dorcoceras hygrometricum]
MLLPKERDPDLYRKVTIRMRPYNFRGQSRGSCAVEYDYSLKLTACAQALTWARYQLAHQLPPDFHWTAILTDLNSNLHLITDLSCYSPELIFLCCISLGIPSLFQLGYLLLYQLGHPLTVPACTYSQ